MFALDASASNVFRFRITGVPETLDWNLAHTPVELTLLLNLHEGLMTFSTEGNGLTLEPALAESYRVSADGKTYTYRLKKGLKWSDGKSLTARDFVYSWKRLLSPATGASYAYLLYDIQGARAFGKGQGSWDKVGIKAPDDRTLIVQLENPVSYWKYIPSFWVTFPIREDSVSAHGTSWTQPGKMLTAGPFMLSAYDLQSRYILVKNPNYRDASKVQLDEVHGVIVTDDSTALNLYESGALDFVTDLSTLDLVRLKGRSDLKTFPYLKTGYLGMVSSKFPTNQKKVRRAIAMAIDRSGVGRVLKGGQIEAKSYLPPELAGHSDSIALKFNPAAAKEELKNAGFGPNRPLSLEILIPNNDKTMVLAQFVQAQLKQNLGAAVSIRPFDNKTFRAQVGLKQYPLFLLSWGADYPDPDNFMSVFTSEGGNNRLGWSNSKYDAWVAEARILKPGSSKRTELYQKAQNLLQIEEAALLPIYYEPIRALIREGFLGVKVNPLNYMYLRGVRKNNLPH